MSEKTYTIELDCAPGYIRPGDLLSGVLEGTGITLDPKKPQSMFFGNWEWRIPDEQIETYLKVRDTIKERITKLYNNGDIRYGSW